MGTSQTAAVRNPERAVPEPRRWTRDRVETAVLRVLRWVGIAFFLVITVFPFYYMVMLSVRSMAELQVDPGGVLLALRDLSLATYKEVLQPVDAGGQGFMSFLINSAIVSMATVAVTLAVAIPGAYAVARLDFFGRRQVHFLFLAVYLFPAILLAIPLFLLFSRAGLRGSLLGLVIVYIAQAAPVTIYMLRNYFETVPASLEEASSVDGAGRLRTLWSVTLPLARPAILATGLYVFMIAWNEYLFALLFLVEERGRWTVSLGLAQLSDSLDISKTVLMAGSVVLTLPVVVLFFLAERFLTEGLTQGAEKG